jgi:hypothetical protein
MMGARRGVERGNNEGKEVMARLEHARLGNVMTYGLMNDGMFGRGKISLYVWLYNGGELVIKYSASRIIEKCKRSDLVDESL